MGCVYLLTQIARQKGQNKRIQSRLIRLIEVVLLKDTMLSVSRQIRKSRQIRVSKRMHPYRSTKNEFPSSRDLPEVPMN